MDDPIAELLGEVQMLVRRLRLRHGLEQAAKLVGRSRWTFRRYEKGLTTPGPKMLARLGEMAGMPPGGLKRLRRLRDAQRLAKAEARAGKRTAAPPLAAAVTAVVLKAIDEADAVLALEPAPEPWEDTGRPRPEDRGRAEELWRRLAPLDRVQRSRLVRESAVFRIWSFVERLAYESEAATADAPAEALELAQLALALARELRGAASWRARVEALLALPILGNALRVCNEFGPARAAFEQASEVRLRDALSPSDPQLLDEGLSRDLEASLCREERRFPEALVLHDEAFSLSPVERRGSILLNKAFTLEQMGDTERALTTLQEAEPYVLATGTPRDLCVLRFNTAVCLCTLGKASEAEGMLTEIHELADQLGALARLRTRWLASRVAAGLGQVEEAITILDQVSDDFLRCDPPLPYEAALAGLDLALYWLELGNIAAVKQLAPSLKRVFTAKGIRREALSSLWLFCEAARREAATLDLAQRAKAEVQRSRAAGRISPAKSRSLRAVASKEF